MLTFSTVNNHRLVRAHLAVVFHFVEVVYACASDDEGYAMLSELEMSNTAVEAEMRGGYRRRNLRFVAPHPGVWRCVDHHTGADPSSISQYSHTVMNKYMKVRRTGKTVSRL